MPSWQFNLDSIVDNSVLKVQTFHNY